MIGHWFKIASVLHWAALQAEMMCRVTIPNAINGCSSSALDLEGLADPWGHAATVPRHRPNVCPALISFHWKKKKNHYFWFVLFSVSISHSRCNSDWAQGRAPQIMRQVFKLVSRACDPLGKWLPSYREFRLINIGMCTWVNSSDIINMWCF